MAVAFQSMWLERLAGLVRPDAAKLRGAETHEAAPAQAAARADVGKQGAGAQIDEPGVDGDVEWFAQAAPR